MIAISTKEFRQKLPFVRSELHKGTIFMLIHRSKPFAELRPINENLQLPNIDEETLSWEESAMQDMWEDLGGDPSEEEINYYKSLIQKNNANR